MAKIYKNNRILLPDSLRRVLIEVAVNNGLAKVRDRGNITVLNYEYNHIVNGFRLMNHNDSYLQNYHKEYKQKRYDSKIEQQL